ncbi:MAG TPA: class I SAM-dependent methyltransferase [Verrucomicrobiae bacterium]|nr:class I SAM-dependent methyltransferase [Verrucomicrobiae bacterium]
MAELYLIIGLAMIGLIVPIWFLSQGAPFVPTSDSDAEQMVRIVKRLRPRKIIDLGAGDGKLVELFATHGYSIDGIEINPRLVRRGQRRLARHGLTGRATIRRGNLWKIDIGVYDMVVLYAVSNIMGRLEGKLRSELRPGSFVISNYFAFPNLVPIESRGRIRVYRITPGLINDLQLATSEERA